MRIQDIARLNDNGEVELLKEGVSVKQGITSPPGALELTDSDGVPKCTYRPITNELVLGTGVKLAETWKRTEINSPVIPEIPAGTRVVQAMTEPQWSDKVVIRDGKLIGYWGTLGNYFYYSPDLKFPKAVRYTKGDKWFEVRENGVVCVSSTMRYYSGQYGSETPKPIDLSTVEIRGSRVYAGTSVLLEGIDSTTIGRGDASFKYIKEVK